MKFFYSKGGENGNANRAEGIKWLDTNETHIKPHRQVSRQFSSNFKPRAHCCFPAPLPKTNPVIHNRRFGSKFSPRRYSLIRMPRFLSKCREDLFPVSVLMLFFLGLYLLLAAFLITAFQGDYATTSATPSACDPPDAFLRRTPRSIPASQESLCT
jgi:hypothetical protein